MGKFQPGQSGNPAGRPPKSRALADILYRSMSRTIEVDGKRTSRKRLIARLVVEGITTGKVKFPGETEPSVIGVRDWIEFMKWVYQYLDPPIQRNELTGADGGPIEYAVHFYIPDNGRGDNAN